MTHHPTTVAVGLSMTVFEVGIADRQWRLVERRRLNRKQFGRFLADQPPTAAHQPLTGLQPWAVHLAARKGHNKTTIAVANKLARIVWAVWARDVAFRVTPVAA